MPRGHPGLTVKTPTKTPITEKEPLQPRGGWATRSLQKRKPRGEGRPFEPGNPGGGRPKGSKTRTPLQKALEKPKQRGKPGIPANCKGGRRKGSPNKISRDLKEAYLLAANLAGGKEGLVGYLKTQAQLANPSAFMTGLSKLLPLMMEGNPNAPLIVERVYYTRDGDA
jgi:hypothetical protein